LLVIFLGSAFAENWAVIVAGSNEFYNYRHQADACHAYQIVANNGVPSSNIIMLYYDDIASDPSNPFPGQLFNKPTDAGVPGVDVYKNCQKDYTGEDVTAENFLNIITGNATAMKGIGNGKVLGSTSNDNVFINFVDHGGAGLICFPTGPYLYSNDLINALNTMYTNNMYKKLVFYVEACESGSMFEGLISSNQNIYVTTASNAEESSWGTYCPPDDFVNGQEMNSCLGDLYSVNWMEDADKQSPKMDETLEIQFEVVQNETDQSHVMQYGDITFTSERIGDFEGETQSHNFFTASLLKKSKSKKTKRNSVDSRDAKLNSLYYMYLRSDKTDLHRSHLAAAALEKELKHRVHTDMFFSDLALALTINTKDFDTVFHAKASRAGYLSTCYKRAIQTYEKKCERLSDYSLQYARVLANVCERSSTDLQARAVFDKITEMCTQT